jgi:protein-L-isoaspartate(D-aspartate) O-methyltransferase
MADAWQTGESRAYRPWEGATLRTGYCGPGVDELHSNRGNHLFGRWFPARPSLKTNRPAAGGAPVPESSPPDDRIGRMEFLLNLRRRGIADQAVLRAMDEVPREHFVAAELAGSAYEDHALPIACGQTISQPYVVAYMTERLELRPQHRVLEVGTGSGYQAAVLSRLAREVVTVERYRTLAEQARIRLHTLGFRNVEVIVGDGLVGYPPRAPFERILVTAAAERLPSTLTDQLADGGIMVLPLGPHSTSQNLVKITKTQDGLKREDLIGVRFVPLLSGPAREL